MVDLHTCSNIQGHISDSDSSVKLVLISAFVFFHVGMENYGIFLLCKMRCYQRETTFGITPAH